MKNNIRLGTRMYVQDVLDAVRKDKSIDDITVMFYHPEDGDALWMYRVHKDGYECVGCGGEYSDDYGYKDRYFTTKDKELFGYLSPKDCKQIKNKEWQHNEYLEFMDIKRKAGILRRINGKGIDKVMARLCSQKGYLLCTVRSVSYKPVVTTIPPQDRPQMTVQMIVRNKAV